MRFLASLDRVDRKVAMNSRASGLATWNYGRPYTATSPATDDIDRIIRESYDRTTWIYRAVEAIASTTARLPIMVRRDDPTTGEPIDHPLLRLLNFAPNDQEQAYFFRHRVSSQLLLSKRGVFIEKLRSRGGGLLGLQLLPPQFTRPIPDPKTFVAGYELQIGGLLTVIPSDDVVWLRAPHPSRVYESMTPLEAAGLAIDTDWYARVFNRRYLGNDAGLAGLVAVKGDLLPDDADEIKARFSGRHVEPGTWSVIEADGLDIMPMTGTPHDAQWVDARQATKDEILVAFGTPESMLGNASERTFANADAESENWWQTTILPHIALVGGAFDLIDGDANTFTVHDTSDIPPLQRAAAQRRAELRDEWARGLITTDEYRVEIGRDPFDEPATRTLYQGLSQVGYATQGGAAPVAPAAGGTSAARLAVPQIAEKALPSVTVDMRRAAGVLLTHWEGVIASAMRDYFRRQREVVLAKLRGPKARIGTRHDLEPRGRRAVKAIDIGVIWNQARWDETLLSDATSILTRVYGEAGKLTSDSFGRGNPFDVHDDKVTAAIVARGNKITRVNGTTRDEIRAELAAGEANGESIDQLAGRVAAVFDRAEGPRAEMIARTETVGSVNEASWFSAGQSGVVESKQWLATSDDRTRPDHLDVDGTEVGLGEVFDVGGSEMLYPGDEQGADEQVINCRCTLTYGVPE